MGMLPTLALGWLMVASTPAVKYKVSARVESIVRTPLLTETVAEGVNVISDMMFAPRLDSVLYTNKLEFKLSYEPQFFMRQATQRPTMELLQSIYAKADYKIRRDLTLLALHTTTYGDFPLNSYGGAGGSSLPVEFPAKTDATSAYIYTETVAGFWTSLGIKRLSFVGTLGWIVNGLLDPPVRPLVRGDAAYPQQRFPELRLQAVYGLTRRDYLSVLVYGRDVSFSTANRDSLLRVTPGLQHSFTALTDLNIEPGIAVGRVYPRRPDEAPFTVLIPTFEATLTTPVPLGNHWPVKARLRARYLPYMDPLTTQLIPRGEAGMDLEWKGRRDARVLGKLRFNRPLTPGIHREDADVRASIETLHPLPLSRYLFLQTKGEFNWVRHVVLTDRFLVQWFTSVGLVVRYDRGRL